MLDGGLERYSRVDTTEDSGNAVGVTGHLAMSGNFAPVACFGITDVRDNLVREALNEDNISALVDFSNHVLGHKLQLQIVRISCYVILFECLHITLRLQNLQLHGTPTLT